MDKETFIKSEPVLKLQETTTEQLTRKELGIKDFSSIMPKLSYIKGLLDDIVLFVIDSPINVAYPLEIIAEHISRFNSLANEILKYNLENDGRNNFQIHRRIENNISEWYNEIFVGFNSNNNRSNNLLSIFLFLKQDIQDVDASQMRIKELEKQLRLSIDKSNQLVELLKEKATAQTVEDYSLIFKNQARNHSQFCTLSKWPFLILGNAEKWLFLSLILIVGFGFLVFKINEIFPISNSSNSSVHITLELVTRVLMISFSLYLISFSLKQYSIQKHLFTQNKHRENTLNSYRLFIESLDTTDPVTKNALMMEVAKAIYESGNTGYVNLKDSSESTPSIIEMTRFVNKQ